MFYTAPVGHTGASMGIKRDCSVLGDRSGYWSKIQPGRHIDRSLSCSERFFAKLPSILLGQFFFNDWDAVELVHYFAAG
jgi:hypothetical protein